MPRKYIMTKKNIERRRKQAQKMGLANKGSHYVLGKHWNIKDTSRMGVKGRKVTWGDKISKGNKGKKKSETHRKHISEGHKGLLAGENHWNWQGGIAHLPYSVDWKETLKKAIKERDHYTCQLCGDMPGILYIHHIDYDKINCNPNNLISLCDRCHGKTGFNRDHWLKLLTKILKNKLI